MRSRGGWRYLDLGVNVAVLSVPFMLVLGFLFAFDGAATRIAAPDATWDYLIAFVWAIGLLAFISLLPLNGSEKKALIVLWIVRVGVVLGFMLFYESHYPLDAYGYFHAGMRGDIGLLDASLGDGTTNVKVLAVVHDTLIPGSYHAMKMTWSAFGLAAAFFFYRAACHFMGRRDVRYLYVLGLVPSVVFWGSILGKDPITLLGISMFIYGIIGFDRRRRVRYLLIAAAGLALATWIRVWLGAIFLLPLGLFFLSGRGRLFKAVVLAGIGLPALYFASLQFQSQFQLETTRDLVNRTSDISQSWAFGGSGQTVAGGIDAVASMVAFAPIGAFTALFRPLPGEVLNAFGLFAGVENAVVLGFFLWSIYRGYWRRLATREGAWLIATVVVWAFIYGFASYQNLGTAVRFKVQVVPIMVILLFALYDHNAKPRSPG